MFCEWLTEQPEEFGYAIVYWDCLVAGKHDVSALRPFNTLGKCLRQIFFRVED